MYAKSMMVTLLLLGAMVLGGCAIPIPAGMPMSDGMHGEMIEDGEMMEDDMMEDDMMEDAEMMEDDMMGMETTFHVRIENISGESMIATPFSPGVWVLHSEAAPIFAAGEPNRGEGLEGQSEDGNPMALAASLAASGALHSVFNMPEGTDMAGAARPGAAFEFEITATPNTPYLSFTSMFGQSNDLFIAPNEMGIALFDMDGHPLSGDVTDQVFLWDAGTEANEEPGAGPNQAPRQAGPNTGPADDDNTVRLVADMYSYPAVSELVKITIEPAEMMK